MFRARQLRLLKTSEAVGFQHHLQSGFMPLDYESDAPGETSAVSRRSLTGFSDGVGRGSTGRTYGEPGVGRFAGMVVALRVSLVVVSIFCQYSEGAQE